MSSRKVLLASMVNLPPSGMASRALSARLRMAVSSCVSSASTCHTPPGADDLELHLLAKRRLEKRRQVPQQLVDVEHFGFQRLAPGESQQMGGQACGPLRAGERLIDCAHQALLRRGVAGFERPLGAVEVADDDSQEIVEIVRHAAGELADGVHFL